MTTIKIETIGGFCPVQAEGTIDGKEFYFRARGDSWRIGIGGDPVGNPEWGYSEPWGDNAYAAGWMDLEIAKDMIEKAAKLYMERDNAIDSASA